MVQSAPTHFAERETTVAVTTRREAADSVIELSLAPVDATALPSWTPGAHIDLLLGDDLVRQYSLCSSPADTSTYRVAVLRTPDSRGGSSAVHDLAVGDTLTIRGPRNNFAMVRAARYVFIAGGIGITPMLPMIEEAAAAGADWVLHYGGRSRTSMAYLDHLMALGDRVHVVPQDELGIMDLPSIVSNVTPDTVVYCCGPEPLLAAVESACAHWPPGSLHVERFAAKAVEGDGINTAFDLVLERTGVTITVSPEESVFSALRDAGVSVLGSCLEGICGTCETGVLEGEVDHRDSVLDADERAEMDCMMVCVSRCRGDRLVLDA